jgi:predicted lipoprotein with Yx(FWY)xxD motif
VRTGAARPVWALLAVVALALAIGGCGGSDDSTSGPGPGAYGLDTGNDKPTATDLEAKEEEEKLAARPAKGAWGVVFGAGTEEGMLIVDLSGHTLYTFSRDSGGRSSCYGACAKAWPPALTEDEAKPGGSARPAEVGSTKRTDGTIQLTYFGHPLYRYSGDRSSEIEGNEVEAFGGEWRAIRPNGEAL